ncbi:PhzF family phenazine biosynthesis protein [Mesobacillus foraminis]|uniref:PhzF family phenazine biosynthesis protein n=1 Tax=Mesobacillus foraminis TaxID=279826 RepID=UPI000EF4886F|nr:PhzF family phenazine biosynthesis protein [Mesobacillus foraminis]
MNKLRYYILDVFSQGKYSGNQLAVFRDAEEITDQQMQQIAREVNFSETTFILSDRNQNSRYDVRIFTPQEEVPFAGHPVLGTAYVIQREIIQNPQDELMVKLKAGEVPVSFDYQEEVIWMKQGIPVFGQTINADKMSEVLNLDRKDFNMDYPVQEVSTGLPVIIVPLKSLEAVKNVRINKENYYKLIEHTEAKGIIVFSPETYHPENDVNVRDFADYYGIPEDPATGSSNGCLGSYLVKYRFFGKSQIHIRVEQGYEINRNSLLFVKAKEHGEKIDVRVGGRVEKLAQGEWLL